MEKGDVTINKARNLRENKYALLKVPPTPKRKKST